MTSNEQPAKQRINMAHGFMKSVIRNQIDRDNYDKEVKAKQQQGKHHFKQHPSKPKKPEIQTYVPPQRSKKGIAGDLNDSRQYLYTLEYEHKNGEVHAVHISKSDMSEEVAQKIGEKFDLSETFVRALAQQIQEEMDKRL